MKLKQSKLHTEPFEHDHYERDWSWMRLGLTLLWLLLGAGVVNLLMVVMYG